MDNKTEWTLEITKNAVEAHRALLIVLMQDIYKDKAITFIEDAAAKASKGKIELEEIKRLMLLSSWKP